MPASARLLFLFALTPVLFCCERPLSIQERAIPYCKEAVEDRFRYPGSIKWLEVESSDHSYDGINPKLAEVHGELDASNAYGTPVRNEFYCFATFDDLSDTSPSTKVVVGDESGLYLKTVKVRDELQLVIHDNRQTKIRHKKRRDKTLKPPDLIKYNQFLTFYEGMTLRSLQEKIGDEGKRQSEKKVVTGYQYFRHLNPEIWRWYNHDGSYLQAVVKNGKVTKLTDEGLW